jgi:TatD DNase family protein
MIIDTHCHLDDEKYNEDLEKVLENSKKSGIQGIVIPGADINDLAKAKEISYTNKEIYYAAGVHPYHIDEYDENILREYLKDERCIAVGECGLDYYRLPEDEDKKIQEKLDQAKIFQAQIELAKSVQKPLIIHIRDANEDSKRLLIENNAREVGGVLHCYNASEHLLELAEHGFYFGIGGVLTFKNAKKLVEILPKIPLERLLIETDAPYLTPHPFRGERNEPAYTTYVAQKMADILEKSVTEIENITTQNAKRLFKAFAKSI